MVVVGTERDVLATFGPHGNIETEQQLNNWIDTSAQAVIFLISFKYLGFMFYDISVNIEEMKKEIKQTIKDYLDRANMNIDFRLKAQIEKRIYERIEKLFE